jgi:ribosomal protein L37AE/L43A
MSDAYRSSPHLCPTCGNTALREYGHNLVCDECNGMLIPAAELAASINELDGGSESLTTSDARASDKPCPKCAGAMTSNHVAVGTMKLHDRLLVCATDGVWCSQEAMAATFARAYRRSQPWGRGGIAAGSISPPSLPGASGGMAGAMASIGRAFGGGAASSGLAISHWADARPRVHTLFVSAYKDRALGCPSCKEAKLQFRGDRWDCDVCKGSFVEDAALSAMVMEMTAQPWVPPTVKGAPGDRQCPVCKTAMIVEVLEAVTTDRCAAHGVWFDDKELQDALAHASAPAESWVRKLFHRHGKPEA